MILRNNMEELVLNVVNEMVKDITDDFWQNEAHKHEVACYVLNRVKPVYITSAKGLLHWEIELEKNIQEHVDTFALVAEGMKIVSSSKRNAYEKHLGEEGMLYFHFPYFLGKVISAATWEEVSDIKVTLKHSVGEEFVITSMINDQWKNPYTISEEHKGYYTFFPHPIKDESVQSSSQNIEFMLVFEHPNFELFDRCFSVQSTSERRKYSIFQTGQIYRIDDVYINIK